MNTDVYEAEQSNRVQTARRHARMLDRRAAKGSLLDVGCASGIFIHEASRRGWRVTGIEPNTHLAARAAKLVPTAAVRNTTLEEADLEPGSFDAVTLWDVLEHVADPTGFLTSCRRLIKPAGTILLKVPDLDSWQARIMGASWPLLLPEHLSYFTRASIRACAERAGLETLATARGAVTFSAGYILYRMSQHSVPGAKAGYRAIRSTGLGGIPIPMRLGELYAFLRPKSPPADVPGSPLP
jgi:2-polyprenyl-3-methyl-5-hydroxy-6-metoxy-1,4-benzoquinol methylase